MKSLRQFWRANFLPVEFAVALLLGLAFVIWSEILGGKGCLSYILTNNRAAIYGALASIFGSLLGFAITAVSIVLGFSQLDILAVVRNSVHYSTLWKIYISAMRVLAFATIVSLVGLVGDKDAAPHFWALYLAAVMALLAIVRVARCIWVLEKVIALVTAPPKERIGGA